MEQNIVLLLLAAVIGIAALLSIRIAKQYERFALHSMGRFAGLKGPGLIVRWPVSGMHWTRISIGDTGELIGADVARFSQIDLPAMHAGNIPSGSAVRVTGFTADAVEIEPDPTRTRKITCERCGHQMTV